MESDEGAGLYLSSHSMWEWNSYFKLGLVPDSIGVGAWINIVPLTNDKIQRLTTIKQKFIKFMVP